MSDQPPTPPLFARDAINSIDITQGTIDANGDVRIPVTADTVVKHNPDGSVTIPISDDTFARLEAMRRPGETDSDVLRRLLEKAMKGTNASIVGRDGGHRASTIKRKR
jgi:predicted CopG family antitoxin